MLASRRKRCIIVSENTKHSMQSKMTNFISLSFVSPLLWSVVFCSTDDTQELRSTTNRLIIEQMNIRSLLRSQSAEITSMKSELVNHARLLKTQSSLIDQQRNEIYRLNIILNSTEPGFSPKEEKHAEVRHAIRSSPISNETIDQGHPGYFFGTVPTETIAFNVRKPRSTPEAGLKVVFAYLESNYGNGYDTSTGLFTCTSAGTYVFFHSLMISQGHSASAGIVLNGAANGHASAQGDTYSSGSGSVMSVYKLVPGDQVWVQIFSIYPGSNIEYAATSFAGFKIG